MWGLYSANVDVTTCDKILKNLDVAKASGIDQVSAKLLKNVVPVIAIHLTNIINLSIKLNTFPSKWKITKVKPLFTKGIKTQAEKYRPISLLPLKSKVIEKSIHDQTQDYLQRNGLFYVHNEALEQIISQTCACLG